MNEKLLAIDTELKVYRLLHGVFIKGAYSGIELDKTLQGIKDERERARITRLFYGVLEKSIYLDYCIGTLSEKAPKPSVALVLKIGLYEHLFMSTPLFAAADKAVSLCHAAGKGGVSGYVNAVMRKGGNIPPPTGESSAQILCSIPPWLYGMLKKQYDDAFITAFFNANNSLTHIRRNGLKLTEAQFEQKYAPLLCGKSALGYYAEGSALKKLDPAHFTAQGLASMMAVTAYAQGLKSGAKVLDMCAAPGGKAVYLYELTKADITACDVHPHRVELIKSYAQRMGAKLTTALCDATAERAEFLACFDAVVCDVPCSGIGVIGSKPDILLNRRPEDIAALAALQQKILDNGAKYVRAGGTLHYSTCTVLKKENEAVTNAFLAAHPEFSPLPLPEQVFGANDGTAKLFPHTHGTDGFFIASFIKKQ